MKKLRFKTISHAVLEKMGELGIGFLDAFFPYKYTFTRPSRRLLGLDNYPHKFSLPTLRSTINRLQRQGLILKDKNKIGTYEITAKGQAWLLERNSYLIPLADGITRLVIFDIPEKERKKRDRVRAELAACGFQQLQKSVWKGETPLPEDFIDLLDNLRLKNKVHIFSVRESGTLNSE